MKKPIVRVLSVLLAVIITFGLMPTLSFAGGDENIEDISIFLAFPIAGQHPTTEAVPCDPSENRYTIEWCNYYNDAGMGRAVYDEETFEAGETYMVELRLSAKEGYDFISNANVTLNGRAIDEEMVYTNDAYYSVLLTAASETVEVTLDANGFGTAPAPLQVPKGGTIWDAIRNFDAVRMPDQSDAHFYNWSEDPFATSGSDFPFTSVINAPKTLYAAWEKATKSVELYVKLPRDLLSEPVFEPDVYVGRYANYTAEPAYFYEKTEYFSAADGNVYYPFEPGKTYYSYITVYCALGSKLPSVTLHGGKLLWTERASDYSFRVIYSVTMPKDGAVLNAAEYYIDTPRAGDSAEYNTPHAFSLTPGVEAEGSLWYTNAGAVNLGEPFSGNFVGGQTYYTMVELRSPYTMNSDLSKWKVTARGWKIQIPNYYDLGNWYALPTYIGAVTGVTIPRRYVLAAEVPYGGGKFRYNRAPSDTWRDIIDFHVEEGPVTLEAKADPEHLFKMWYDADSYETLSKVPVYSFNLERDMRINASFVKKPPFVDVGAWDYFYEPVMWAIEHDPVITGGTDKTHFSPKAPCPREQIVTFLWKANGAPEPKTTINPFSDVKSGKYYYKAVLWAAENGITSGVGGGKFGVGKNCTREQAMVFLWNAKGSPTPSSYDNPFSDVKAGKYYYNAILWAVNRKPKVTGGVSAGKFGVGQTCTRAQIITFLAKVYAPAG